MIFNLNLPQPLEWFYGNKYLKEPGEIMALSG